MSKNPATMQRFIEIGSGVSCLCVISHHSRQSDSAIFWVFEKGHDRNTPTNFDAKYVKRRGSAQGSAL